MLKAMRLTLWAFISSSVKLGKKIKVKLPVPRSGVGSIKQMDSVLKNIKQHSFTRGQVYFATVMGFILENNDFGIQQTRVPILVRWLLAGCL
jgi:hypothetical protein